MSEGTSGSNRVDSRIEDLRAGDVAGPKLDLGLQRLPDELALKKRKELVLFVGAGVSMASGGPSWEDFVSNILSGLSRKIFDAGALTNARRAIQSSQPGHFKAVMAAIQRKHDKFENGTEIYKQLVEDSQPSLKDASSAHLLLTSAQFPIILTTNYDHGLEHASRELSLDYLCLTPEGACSYLDRGETLPKCIIHLHGRFADDKPVVLTSLDYRDVYETKGNVRRLLESLFKSYGVFFIGASFGDEDIFEELLSVDDSLERPHFALVPEPSLVREMLIVCGFQEVFTYGVRDHEEGDPPDHGQFLQQLEFWFKNDLHKAGKEAN